jgi:outer membrane biosynthesis protein TonB
LRLLLNQSCGMLGGMVRARLDSDRLSLASYPVARAFALSLLFHALLFVTLELGFQTGLWNVTFLFPKRQIQIDPRLARLMAEAQKRKQQQQEQEMPLVFLDVDPSQATAEAPKDAKFYSALNSRAANPDTTLDTPLPKIEGKQERVPQTLNRGRPEPQPLQPQPAPTPPPQPQVAETKPEPEPPPREPKPAPEPEPPPQPTVHPGDLAMAKPADKPPTETERAQSLERSQRVERVERPNPAPQRIRRLAEARQQKGISGEKMKQPGGVKRFALDSSFDVRATPFGAYDAAIIEAIRKHWYDLLDNRDFAANYSGKVVVEFRLNSDGRVTDMKVNENDVTEILALFCQRAVQDPAPFAPWPPDLRRLVGKEYRDVRFTFYYN